jgi:hypothetical protein
MRAKAKELNKSLITLAVPGFCYQGFADQKQVEKVVNLIRDLLTDFKQSR